MEKIVLYISSKAMKQTIDHSIKELNLFTLDFNNQVGNIISLNEFVKYKGLTLGKNDADYLVIDLAAIKDDDTDIILSIQSLMIAHENIRIIILSQLHLPGDKLLSDLFSLGVRNFAISNDYVDIKNKLNICLSECGMSYKDASEYKDIKDNSKRERHEIKEINKVMIGVIGSQSKVGCTHNSIIVANELKRMGYSVAVLEMNKSGAFEDIRLSEKLNLANGYFSSRNIDYYPGVSKETLKDSLADKVYNFVILDFGDFLKSEITIFNKCHVKIAIANAASWEVKNIVEFWNRYDEEAKSNINLYFNFIEKQNDQKELSKIFGRSIGFIGFQPDPFSEYRFPNLKILLRDYIDDVKPVKKKKFLIF